MLWLVRVRDLVLKTIRVLAHEEFLAINIEGAQLKSIQKGLSWFIFYKTNILTRHSRLSPFRGSGGWDRLLSHAGLITLHGY